MNASNVIGINGIWNLGKLPAIDAKSLTLGTAKSKKITIPVIMQIATKGGGIVLDIFDIIHIISIVPKTRVNVRYRVVPVIQT